MPRKRSGVNGWSSDLKTMVVLTMEKPPPNATIKEKENKKKKQQGRNRWLVQSTETKKISLIWRLVICTIVLTEALFSHLIILFNWTFLPPPSSSSVIYEYIFLEEDIF